MSIVPSLRVSEHEVWVTVLLFLCLLLFAWVRITNPKKIPSLVSGFFRGGATEEKNITPDSIALFFVFICSATLLVMQVFRINGIQTRLNNGGEFLAIGLVLFAYYLLKTIALLLCGVIFQVQADTRDYINEIYASVHLAAIGLLPLVIVLIFVNNINEVVFEKGILALIVLFFLYRTIKMFILMMNRGLSVIYLFLYLCALEIIPLVLLFEYRKGLNF
jgi:Domain of unknown function (DUF4271)